jgi:hypothetical protein
MGKRQNRKLGYGGVIKLSDSDLEREIELDREFMDTLSYLGYRIQYDFTSFSDSSLVVGVHIISIGLRYYI